MTTVWTYWEGPIPPIIRLCLDTLERWNPDFRLVGPEEIRQLEEDMQDPIWVHAEGLPIPQRSDLIRLWLLYHCGGVWVDTDTIQTGPLDFLGRIPEVDLLGVYNPYLKRGHAKDGILATPFGARPRSPAIWAALERCKGLSQRMRAGEHVQYGATSTGLLSWLWKTRNAPKPFTIERREHWKYCPVPWHDARKVFLSTCNRDTLQKQAAWKPNARLYHLTNVIVNPRLSLSREAILASHHFYAWLLKIGLGLPPAIFGRTREILDRLPSPRRPISTTPLRGAEIGVLGGQNAQHLLQQHWGLHLTLVDSWGQSPDPSYRSTGDYQTRFSRAKWEHLYQTAVNRLSFAADRHTLIRQPSVQAAQSVPDLSLDFAFVDGNHSYEAVKADIAAWYPKVRPGGFIGGHDYNHRKNQDGRYGVNRAVDEWASLHGSPVETGKDWTWFVRL